MKEILIRLTAACLLTAMSEQLVAGGKLEDGVRLVAGLTTALLMLEAALSLSGALMG